MYTKSIQAKMPNKKKKRKSRSSPLKQKPKALKATRNAALIVGLKNEQGMKFTSIK
jgi:hypothetical protein